MKTLLMASLSILVLLISVLVSMDASAQDSPPLLVKPAVKTSEKLNAAMFDFIAGTLNAGRVIPPLECSVRIREIKQERKFSTGTKLVEMLEITYRSNSFDLGEQKMYFPMGSRVGRQQKVNQFSGVVEEIHLEADDRLNSHFIFQHDGSGHISFMTFENDLMIAPCRLKRH